jgi:hypothetical protein
LNNSSITGQPISAKNQPQAKTNNRKSRAFNFANDFNRLVDLDVMSKAQRAK